ncbi:YiiX/YebB-like N1pC/P60 family cysteine hydrolase [Maritimibacter sp. DP1N21-5]|uniref:YiiX/YebB-like N1pC/P60 family cysteine hydrolase n=1 Tax=Maritimibacter sp. DP1N21-5 TaxID=2836867 RepID=UPI001C44AC5E|nr:YiiX/YebB-like N1pC/P60 family cysteine hydrolase [Maritimibacter sp. DP1N21-5]MBV7407665.1 hypothetical protein [Maritimibacter sp. DP1N21-5]
MGGMRTGLWATIKRLMPALVLLGLAACTMPVVHPDFEGLPPDADPSEFTCCQDPERQPRWFADLARNMGETLEPLTSDDGHGGLLAARPEAQARVADAARPLDIMVFAAKSQMVSRMIPGWFTHSAVYLGTEKELRAAGLWNHPALAPFRDDIRAGRVVVDGVPPKVRLASLEDVLSGRDAVLVTRPEVTASEKSAALGTMLSLVGRPFDFHFDFETCDSYACTEVICRSFPGLKFPIRESYGAFALLPDDIAAKAIRGDGLRIVDYVRATEDDWRAPGLTGAMEDVAGFWGPQTGPVARVTTAAALGTCPL